MSSEQKFTEDKNLEECKRILRELKDLKLENAKLKHQIMLMQAIAACEMMSPLGRVK